MIILGIESSCDETAAAILRKTDDKIEILSSVVASSLELQAKWGGIVPEQAAREQLKSIIPVITEALDLAFPNHLPFTNNHLPPIDAIAVTQGPGLIGSLLVGVETAKTLALVWQKPLIPVNHLIGHFYANFINQPSALNHQLSARKSHSSKLTPHDSPTFPCIGLLVSGGHTDLVLFENHGKFKYLGGTRDDAAGECFDKCARLLGLPYPGGPQISLHAQIGNPNSYKLPKPMYHSKDLDFSFSGLKTAVSNLVRSSEFVVGRDKADLCASLENTICEVLIKKTFKAAQIHQVSQIMIAGGVAANQKLASLFTAQASQLKAKIFIPPPSLCTDNAAMIAAAAFFLKPLKTPLDLQANPNLSLSN